MKYNYLVKDTETGSAAELQQTISSAANTGYKVVQIFQNEKPVKFADGAAGVGYWYRVVLERPAKEIE